MKKITLPIMITAIIVVVFFLSLNSQNSFEIFYSTPQSDRITDIIEDENGNYIAIGFSGDIYITQDTLNSYILNISNTGDTTIKEYINPDTGYIFKRITKNYADGYLVFGSTFKYPNDFNSKLTVFKLDNNFDIEWKKIYDFGVDNTLVNKILPTSDGGFHLLATSWYDFQPYALLCRFNGEGDTLRTRLLVDEDNTTLQLDDIVFSTDSSELYLFGVGYGYNAYGAFAIYDTNYNYKSYSYLPEQSSGFLSANWILDTTLLISSHYTLPSPIDCHSIGVYKSDTSFENIVDLHQYYSLDTADYPAGNNAVDYNNIDSIFLLGTHNSCGGQWSHEKSWIILRQLKFNLDARSELFIGGDAFYYAISFAATSDGGCIIGALRYDYTVQDKEWDVYIIKLAKENIITNSEQINAIENYNIYPNPGSNFINICINERESDIQIFNVSGNLVKEQKLVKGHNIISTFEFHSGIYFYKITGKSGRINSGCWIKK